MKYEIEYGDIVEFLRSKNPAQVAEILDDSIDQYSELFEIAKECNIIAMEMTGEEPYGL